MQYREIGIKVWRRCPVERLILNRLLEWKSSPYRKPLILKGVRQVGKTWALKEFGRRYYENTAYFNFDENEEYQQFFETTKDVERFAGEAPPRFLAKPSWGLVRNEQLLAQLEQQLEELDVRQGDLYLRNRK